LWTALAVGLKPTSEGVPEAAIAMLAKIAAHVNTVQEDKHVVSVLQRDEASSRQETQEDLIIQPI
jgi:hypothetical protein